MQQGDGWLDGEGREEMLGHLRQQDRLLLCPGWGGLQDKGSRKSGISACNYNPLLVFLNASGQVPVVVDFSAQWCGPCKMLTPRLDAAIAAQEGAVDLAIVDIDDLAELAMEHNVNAVPTVIGVKGGKVIDRFVGLLEEDKLSAFIDNLKES